MSQMFNTSRQSRKYLEQLVINSLHAPAGIFLKGHKQIGFPIKLMRNFEATFYILNTLNQD